MRSDKHNSITAKDMGLIFSLFDVTSAQQVSFGILQYVQCILHGLTSVLLCVPFIFSNVQQEVLIWRQRVTASLRNGNRPYLS